MTKSKCWEYSRSYSGWHDKGKTVKINGEWVYFTYNTKTHKYGISYGPKEDIMVISEAKGKAIMAFLEWINE
jgi:hypothetical protein